MQTTLTEEARAGFADPTAEPSALFSSDCWLAFRAGQAARNAGFSQIASAAKSRGYSVRVTATDGRTALVAFKGEDLDQIELLPFQQLAKRRA